MSIFAHPYVTIPILAIIILLMGLFGLHFTMKSVKAANDSAANSFCGIGKLEHDFDKAATARKRRCVVFVSVSLETMIRIYSESKAIRIYERIKRILLAQFGQTVGGKIALYGEEDFVALNNLGQERIAQRIEQCNAAINEMLTRHGAMGVVHVNFGYHVTNATDVSFRTVLDRAKQACSMAEDQQVTSCQWDRSHGKAFERKLSIENHIQSEIDNNRFFLEYQPILNAKTEEIIGVEVLSRLNSPTEGVLTPAAFLSAVNHIGLSQKFDYYIFEKNCKWIASDKETRMKYVYTINFSRYTLCDPNLASNIIRIIDNYEIDYSCIAIEILEDKTLEGNEKAAMVKNITMLKEKGIQVLLDDFGSGHTTFLDLSDFNISIVKIDKSITQNVDNQTGFVILKNVIRTAHDLGFQVLCEGVETEAHKKAVMDAGGDMFQGYYFYRPMPVTELETLLEKQ